MTTNQTNNAETTVITLEDRQAQKLRQALVRVPLSQAVLFADGISRESADKEISDMLDYFYTVNAPNKNRNNQAGAGLSLTIPALGVYPTPEEDEIIELMLGDKKWTGDDDGIHIEQDGDQPGIEALAGVTIIRGEDGIVRLFTPTKVND